MVAQQTGLHNNPSGVSSILRSSERDMDCAIDILQAHKDKWAALSIGQRVTLLDATIHAWEPLLPRMVAKSAKAKDVDGSDRVVAEEWILGPFTLMRYIRVLRRALGDIAEHGRPQIPGPVTVRPDGQVVAQVFPQTPYDKLIYQGITAEVWMQPGVSEERLRETQAWAYAGDGHKGRVALVLGAGNNAAMGPMDVLHRLFVEGDVVLFKVHPVNACLGPLFEEGFKTLIEWGFVRVVYGGADESAYLCNHPGIDHIYIVGSDATYDAVVFGPGPEGRERKLKGEPINTKPITAELGNVSPFIVVPGPWSAADIAYHAEHFVSAITNNSGCNCNTPRVLVTHAGWAQREAFLGQIRKLLVGMPLRTAYYPGAHRRHEQFMEAYPDAEAFGTPSSEQLPWTLATGVDAASENDLCFTSEAFCSFAVETPIEAADTAEYLEKTVEFCNTRLWGTLNANIIVHPRTLKTPEAARAFEQAIAGLRYGAISINHLSSYAFCLGLNPWGAYPGHTITDIQSGMGTTINALMLADTQKTVVRVPFRIKPKPAWFISQVEKTATVFRKLAEFEVAPSMRKIPGIMMSALKKP